MTFKMFKIIIYPYSKNLWIQCFAMLMMKFVLIPNILVVSAYNIDTNYPILYPDNATNIHQYLHTNFSRSYFGYSVILHCDLQENNTWLFIGAPRGNYTRPTNYRLLFVNEPGLVYRCSLPGPCVEIEPAVAEDEQIYLRQALLFGYLHKKHSWFGSAMSIDKSSNLLTVCASRTIMSIVMININTYIDTMQGICYSNQMPLTKLDAEMSDIQHHDFRKQLWFDPLHGFSVTFASLQDERTISRIVGRPNDEISGTITMVRLTRASFHDIYRRTTNLPINDNLSRLGYSVTSGCYFNQTRSLYAVADPGWNYVGQVAIIDPNANLVMMENLHGSDVGEYFGASLASGDLNKDGLHDLIIGAPHWGNDNGRVHIYLGSLEEEFEVAAILEGANEGAHFGYSIASGDIDGDGFNDIIIGAPWEEFGAIYVYNGDANLKDKVTPVMSQKITMQLPAYNLPSKLNIQTFGFSISEPIDIDNNGYADIAVGAYKSGHVVVLRSRPVVKTNLTVNTVPNTLQRNVSNFLIEVCVRYYGYNEANTHAFKISLTIDTRYKRTKETSLQLFSMDPPLDMCLRTNITLLNNIQDFIEPITVYATHDFTYNDITHNVTRDFCKTCPVENKSDKSRTMQALLPFDIECGEDRICNSNISAIVKFWGLRENDSWIIGSNDITLETYLVNYAEPAYLTIIIYTIPHGIILRSILPFCEEYTEGNILIVTCNIGNPFGTGDQKVVKLDLDMRHLTDGSLHGQILEFSTEIQTRSVNHGTHIVKSPFTLQSEAFLSLHGKAIEESYYLPNLHKEQLNINFQHTYQISKSGATPIKKAHLLVNIPTIINDLGSFVFLYKPRIASKYIAKPAYIDLLSGFVSNFALRSMYAGFAIKTQAYCGHRWHRICLEFLSEFDANLVTICYQIVYWIYISGEYHNCLSNLEDLQPNESQEEMSDASDLNAHIIKNNNGTMREMIYELRKRNTNSHTTIAARIIQALYNTRTVKFENLNNNLTVRDIIYLNCSTYNVYCSFVYCDLSGLKTQQDVGKLVIRLTLNATKLEDIFTLDETKVIKFTTEAYVQITQPANRIFSVENTKHGINITTEFHSTQAKTQELQLWVVFVSISLGLILLCIIIIILYMMGFFKRTTKEKLSELKSNEATQ